MKVFLINLAANTERFAVADGQLKRLGVAYERFDAVNGKMLPIEERKKAVNYFRWWCAIGRPIVPAEIGCALSHYQLYQRMIDEGINHACILEDDVVLTDDFPRQLEFVESWMKNEKSQVVLLSNHTLETYEEWSIHETKYDMWAEGYVLNLKAAKALLQANLPIQVPCDHWGRWVKLGVIKLYHAFPPVCSQDQVTFASSTSENRGNVKDKKIVEFMIYKSKRLVGKMIDLVLCLIGK